LWSASIALRIRENVNLVYVALKQRITPWSRGWRMEVVLGGERRLQRWDVQTGVPQGVQEHCLLSATL
jgi:hypothetical protein